MRCNAINLTLVILLLLVLPLTIAEDPITITPGEATGEPPAESETPTDETDETESDETGADADETESDLPGLPIDDGTKDFPTDPKDAGKEVLTAVQQAAIDALKKPINTPDIEPLELPDMFQKPTRIIFGVTQEEVISLEMFVILVSLFGAALFLIYEMISSATFNEITSLVISAGLTLVLSITGNFYKIAQLLFSFADEMTIISLLPKWYIIIFIIAIVFLIIYLMKYIKILFRKIQRERAKERSYKEGMRARIRERGIEALSEGIQEAVSD